MKKPNAKNPELRNLDPKHLQKLREMTGRSQFQLARESGVGRCKISSIENGETEPTPEELSALTKALHSALHANVAEFAALAGTEAA